MKELPIQKLLKVIYPPIFPAVDSKTCRDFPTLHATKNCPYPGYMVEVRYSILVYNYLDCGSICSGKWFNN